MLRIVVVCALVFRCHMIDAAVSAIRCRTPLGPTNGRVIYSSFEYGAELEYECDEGFILQNHHPRICNEDGLWSNDEPECIDGCVIPVLYHGDIEELKLGEYCWSWKKFRYERETTYVKIPPGTILSNGSAVMVFCHTPYSFQGTSTSNKEITCLNGHLLPDPSCLRARCHLRNLQKLVYVDVAATDSVTLSGNRLDVKCKGGYSHSSERPICLNGKWSGNYNSLCKDSKYDLTFEGHRNGDYFGAYSYNGCHVA